MYSEHYSVKHNMQMKENVDNKSTNSHALPWEGEKGAKISDADITKRPGIPKKSTSVSFRQLYMTTIIS